MKYADSRGIKTRQWFTNEMLRQEDINRMGRETYQNILDVLLTLGNVATGAEVFKGLELFFSGGLNAILKAGTAISHTGSYMVSDDWGFVAGANDSFVVMVPEDQVLAFDTGVGQPDRIDIVEIRPVELNTDPTTRNFKDPITSLISTAVVPTGRQYSYEVAIRNGSSMVPVATTAGWIKLAEIRVNAGQAVLGEITPFGDSWKWVSDKSATVSNTIKKVDDTNLVAYWSMDNLPKIPNDTNGLEYVQDEWLSVDGWIAFGGGAISYNNGCLRHTSVSTGDEYILRSFAQSYVPFGKSIKVRIRIVSGTMSSIVLKGGNGSALLGVSMIPTTEWNTFHLTPTQEYYYDQATLVFDFQGQSADCIIDFDFIYVGFCTYLPGSLTDNSGNENHGTVYGASPVEGISGHALKFNGLNDRCSFDILANTDTGAFSKSFIVQGKVRTTEQSIWSRDSGNMGGFGIRCLINASNRPEILLSESGNTAITVTLTADAGSECTSDCQIVYVFIPSVLLAIYKNGVLIKSTTTSVPSATFWSLSQACNLGSLGSSVWFDGWIDEPRFYSRALSADEVYSLYVNKGSGADCQVKSSTAISNSIITRDSAGCAKVTAPNNEDDIALKSTVTADIATHQAIDIAHQATELATPSKIMSRDAAGRAAVVAPAVGTDIALLSTVTTHAAVAGTTVAIGHVKAPTISASAPSGGVDGDIWIQV